MQPEHGYTETAYPAGYGPAAEAAWQFHALHDCRHRVLPDARCDIILRFKKDNGGRPMAVSPVVTGASLRFHIVDVQSATGFCGVRLRPGTAAAVLGIDPGSIANGAISGEAAKEKVPGLSAICCPAASVAELETRLAAFVRSRSLAQDAAAASLVLAFHTSGGRMSIADAAAVQGIGVRTAHRKIVAATGLSPKHYAMVIQFNRALRLCVEGGLDPAAAACEAGYADQAHMSRMFRRMAGITPARLPDLVLPWLPV